MDSDRDSTPSATVLNAVPIPKKHHVFISYRVASEAALAEKLCDKLQQFDITSEGSLRVRCFLDKQSLRAGEEWEQGFRLGLQESCLFIPLVSEKALRPLLEGEYKGQQDNLLIEFENALGMREQGTIQILPLLIGKVEDGAYHRFSAFGGPYSSQKSPTANIPVKDTLSQLFQLQGHFTNPDEIADKISTIVKYLSEDVWPLYRQYWAFREELGPEKMFECVQCGKEYMESKNGEDHCSFHPSGTGFRGFFCCGRARGDAGCKRSRHRAKHHNDYEYFARIELMRSLLNYTDKSVQFGESVCENFDGHDSVASCGVLIGPVEQRGKIYLSMNYSWFSTYTKSDLEIIEKGLNSGASTLVAEVSDSDRDDKENASPEGEVTAPKVRRMSAQWLVEDRQLVGVQLCTESPTSEEADVLEVRFRWRDVALPELLSTKQLSRGGIVEKRASSPRTQQSLVLRRTTADVVALSEPEPTPTKKDVWQGGSGKRTLRLKSAAKDAILVNYDRVRSNADTWQWQLTAVNLTSEPMILMDCKVQFAEAGAQLQDADEVVALAAVQDQPRGDTEFPATVPPSGTATIRVSFRTKAVSERRSNWFNIAWGARQKPMMLKLSVENASGQTTSILSEFHNMRGNLCRKSSQSNSFFWMHYDDPVEFSRSQINISPKGKTPQDGVEVRIPDLSRAFSFDRSALRRRVYEANKEQVDRLPMDLDSSSCDWLKVDFLIDRNLQQVYGFHFQLKKDHEEQQAVCVIPDYSEEGAETAAPDNTFCLNDELAGQPGWEPVSCDPSEELSYAAATPVDLALYQDPDEEVPAAAVTTGAGAAGSAAAGLSQEDRAMLSQVNSKLDLVLSRLQTLEIKLSMIETRIK